MTNNAYTGAIACKGVLVGSGSDVGQLREHNEDSILVKHPVFVVADGMGGHAAGEVASQLAVQTFEAAKLEKLDENALRRVVTEANLAILKGSKDGLGRPGMGTTLTAAIIEESYALIAQIGDSRAYIMQESVLRQVTRDHSLVEELVASGRITEAEAAVHPNRSVITRALGLDSYVQADLFEVKLHQGDRILLCSDGLNTMLDDDTIEDVLLKNHDPQIAADMLVDMANAAGGYDNVSVIVINVERTDTVSAVKLKRKLVRNIIAVALAIVLLVGATITGVYLYAQSRVFLISESGNVALYKGLPGELLGIKLNWLVKTTDISTDALSNTVSEKLAAGIPVESMEKAEKLLEEYRAQQKQKFN